VSFLFILSAIGYAPAMARRGNQDPEPDLFSGLEPPPAPGVSNAPTARTAPHERMPKTSALPPGAKRVDVALERGAPEPFTYWAPAVLVTQLLPGTRVLVPLGPRTAIGYVVAIEEVETLQATGLDPGRIKPVIKTLDEDGTLVIPPILDLARWIARQYACPLGSVLAAVLPAGVKRGAEAARLRMINAAVPAEALRAAAEVCAKKAPKQSAVLHALLAAGEPILATELLKSTEANDAALKALLKKGLIAIHEKAPVTLAEAYAQGTEPTVPSGLTLTAAQESACASIREALAGGRHRAFLLQGVTGSGKTEVYLRALATALETGRQGLVLVPEIALTPQTAARFEERLGRHGVAVLHSHLTDGERAEAWRAVRSGRIGVVIGARSALFAPLERLGCIVIDEEHEGTFKQESTPRYQAREVAYERARAAGAVLILGSATPSLESALAAQSGRCQRLLLPERVRGQKLPPVEIVSMTEENRDTNRYNYLARALVTAVRETVARGEQTILFLNRRGYATVITCLRCGHTERCAQCDITLTSHREREIVTCHYCGMEKPIPETCAECGAPGIKFWGLGTERLEHQVRQTFPDARVARMDSDTMTRRVSYVETLSAFRAGQIDILIGTQMIAKGLDFPNVTLVGIVLADTALHMPDFRSRERTFQLLEQVSGRAGRSEKGGRVLVQTYLPKDPAVLAAAQHDYQGFIENELRERRTYGYPPYTRLARLLIRGKDGAKASAAAREAAEILRGATQSSPLQVLGPSNAPLAMLEGFHRFHILVKSPTGEALAGLFGGPMGRALERLKGADATVDIDPQSML
jgi:primosomal protein N' (replication factor Y)